jgi:hypothetical protein
MRRWWRTVTSRLWALADLLIYRLAAGVTIALMETECAWRRWRARRRHNG